LLGRSKVQTFILFLDVSGKLPWISAPGETSTPSQAHRCKTSTAFFPDLARRIYPCGGCRKTLRTVLRAPAPVQASAIPLIAPGTSPSIAVRRNFLPFYLSGFVEAQVSKFRTKSRVPCLFTRPNAWWPHCRHQLMLCCRCDYSDLPCSQIPSRNVSVRDAGWRWTGCSHVPAKAIAILNVISTYSLFRVVSANILFGVLLLQSQDSQKNIAEEQIKLF